MANFSEPCKLHTDVCTLGLGAILYQNHNGIDHIIGYTRRSIIRTKHKYLGNKLEFLALKWAIIEQFHEYLYGNNFVIYMDNNLVTYAITSAKLYANFITWLLVWQIIILPCAIDQERQMWMQMPSPTF